MLMFSDTEIDLFFGGGGVVHFESGNLGHMANETFLQKYMKLYEIYGTFACGHLLLQIFSIIYWIILRL